MIPRSTSKAYPSTRSNHSLTNVPLSRVAYLVDPTMQVMSTLFFQFSNSLNLGFLLKHRLSFFKWIVELVYGTEVFLLWSFFLFKSLVGLFSKLPPTPRLGRFVNPKFSLDYLLLSYNIGSWIWIVEEENDKAFGSRCVNQFGF